MNISEAFGVTTPTVYTMKDAVECVNPELVIGLELEIENCREADFYERACAQNLFRITEDGSLRGTAYEFISAPMQSQHALTALSQFLTAGKFSAANHSDRTSVHVHVNCTDMDIDNVACLALLYTIFEEILFEFVGENRQNNIYCIPWNQCRNHMDFVFNFLNDPNHAMANWQKYTALNMAPLARQGTVEFRQMHGTASFNKLSKWINIIGALMAYAKRTTLEHLMQQVKTLNTTSEYEMFFATVLQHTLEPGDNYRAKMEEGVIFAKFALISMQTEKPKRIIKSKKAVAGAAARLAEQIGANPARIEEILGQRVNRNGVNVNAIQGEADTLREVPWPFEEREIRDVEEPEEEPEDYDEEEEPLDTENEPEQEEF